MEKAADGEGYLRLTGRSETHNGELISGIKHRRLSAKITVKARKMLLSTIIKLWMSPDASEGRKTSPELGEIKHEQGGGSHTYRCCHRSHKPRNYTSA